MSKTVRRTINYIKGLKLDFDTIAFRGVSGALIAPAVALNLHKHILFVRKPDGNHSGCKIEGNLTTRRYIIVDDCICSGNTIKTIVTTVAQYQHDNLCWLSGYGHSEGDLGKCLAVVLYDQKPHYPKYMAARIVESVGYKVKIILGKPLDTGEQVIDR